MQHSMNRINFEFSHINNAMLRWEKDLHEMWIKIIIDYPVTYLNVDDKTFTDPLKKNFKNKVYSLAQNFNSQMGFSINLKLGIETLKLLQKNYYDSKDKLQFSSIDTLYINLINNLINLDNVIEETTKKLISNEIKYSLENSSNMEEYNKLFYKKINTIVKCLILLISSAVALIGAIHLLPSVQKQVFVFTIFTSLFAINFGWHELVSKTNDEVEKEYSINWLTYNLAKNMGNVFNTFRNDYKKINEEDKKNFLIDIKYQDLISINTTINNVKIIHNN